jgi:hypothetical protein
MNGPRAALAIAAGLLLVMTAPSRAAETAEGDVAVEQPADAGKPLGLTKAKKVRTHAVARSRNAAKVAAIKASKRKAASSNKATATTAPVAERDIPANVANANAQMPGVAAVGEAAITTTQPLEIAANDQLTELGRSLATPPVEDEPRQIATQLSLSDQPQSALPVVTPEPARSVTHVSAASSADAWAQSSLIGKIFIAFGGMLTLASAARMLVA